MEEESSSQQPDEVDGNCVGKVTCETDDDKLDNTPPAYGKFFAFAGSDKYAHSYKMDHKYRGHALVFNQKFFQNKDIRLGTTKDCNELTECLENLGFFVHVHQDLKRSEIEYHLDQASRWNHKDYDCFLVAVLSHGDVGVIFASDIQYKQELLWRNFTPDRCPSLAGKPKIFILEVGRGKNVDVGVTLLRRRTEFDHIRPKTYRIPLEADFIFAYSTPEGFSHWHDEDGRSWFIQALCVELKHRGYTDHIKAILTYVNLRVATEYESNYPQELYKHRNKQVPCFMSTLTRFLQLTPKEYVKPFIKNDDNNNE